jgi:flavin-dependent dehydrogenase
MRAAIGGRDVTENSLVIIGAGLAGLSAGCYAQMNGYRSCIFEHHSPDRFHYGGPVGDAGRRCVTVPIFGPPGGAAAVPSGREAVFGEVR